MNKQTSNDFQTTKLLDVKFVMWATPHLKLI